jgi:putative PIN family toxin of toxin-antitoxin system
VAFTGACASAVPVDELFSGPASDEVMHQVPLQHSQGWGVAKCAEKPSSIGDIACVATHAVCLSLENTAHDVPKVVLDTNAVLDAWVFHNPSMAEPVAAFQDGRVQWVACAEMRQELQHMLAHPSLARWNAKSEHVLSYFDKWALLSPTPVPPCLHRLRCTDPDDQVFIDLALATQARWLLTHDRAVLKLARRARPVGLAIVRPQDWSQVTLAAR